MANVKVVIDGNTVMDSQVTLRQGELPSMDTLRGQLEQSAGGTFKPWLMPTIGTLGAILLDANLKGAVQDTTITVTTRADGWTLDVEHAG